MNTKYFLDGPETSVMIVHREDIGIKEFKSYVETLIDMLSYMSDLHPDDYTLTKI